jgi:hypothetical protein
MKLKAPRWLGAVPVLAAMIVVGAGGGASASTSTATPAAKNCTPAKNVEAIIDDSGSMDFSDPNKFRTKLVDSFAGFTANAGKVFGGIEFGTTPSPLFGPGTLPGVIPAMQASFAQVNADSGGTDYQEAFAGATSHNGSADARIFLTDGFPDAYPTSHLSPKIKTYVIGIGLDFASDPAAQSTLAQIAAETGGPAPFLVTDSAALQPVAGAITAALNCKAAPITITKVFNKAGQTFNISFKPSGNSADVLITWPTDGTVIIPSLGGGGGHASSAKTKIKVKRGTTSSSAKLKGLKKGKKVKFKVKAKVLPAPTTATIQIVR